MYRCEPFKLAQGSYMFFFSSILKEPIKVFFCKCSTSSSHTRNTNYMFAALHCLELPILKNLRIYLYFRIFFSRWFKYSTVNNDKKNYPISGNRQSNIFDIVSKTLFTCIHPSEFRICLKNVF